MDINVVSDLYVAGYTEDGEAYTAECYGVVAEFEDGSRRAAPVEFRGCKVEECYDDEWGHWTAFRDVREEALAEAEAYAAAADDVADWAEVAPAYGSVAHQGLGDAGVAGLYDATGWR